MKEFVDDLICFIMLPWKIICRLFSLGKFNVWITDYPYPGHALYKVEPWHSLGYACHSNCERKWCIYKCKFINY